MVALQLSGAEFATAAVLQLPQLLQLLQLSGAERGYLTLDRGLSRRARCRSPGIWARDRWLEIRFARSTDLGPVALSQGAGVGGRRSH